MSTAIDRQARDRIGPGRPCTVCEHPQREQIDDDLRCGVRYRTIANRYGLASHVNVIRHAKSHLTAVPAAVVGEDLTDPTILRQRLAEIHERLRRWLDVFEEAGRPREAIAASDQILKTLALADRIAERLDWRAREMDESMRLLVGHAMRMFAAAYKDALEHGEQPNESALISNALRATAREVA